MKKFNDMDSENFDHMLKCSECGGDDFKLFENPATEDCRVYCSRCGKGQ